MLLKRFSDPPINEVVCGIRFEPVQELDPVLVGRLWSTLAPTFSRHQLMPAVVDQKPWVVDFAPVPRLRTWLISEDDTRVMQVQADRFHLNWRRRPGRAYPSFRGSPGQPGLFQEVIDQFGHFETSLRQEHNLTLKVVSIEVTMVDLLTSERHWRGLPDLAGLVPAIAPFLVGVDSLPSSLRASVEGEVRGLTRAIAIHRATLRSSGADTIQLETTARLDVGSQPDVPDKLMAAHQLLKDTFVELVPETHHERFETGWSPNS